MGIALIFYIFYKSEKFENTIVEINNDLSDTNEEDSFALTQLNKEKKKFINQKKRFNFIFSLCAFLLIIVGFSFL